MLEERNKLQMTNHKNVDQVLNIIGSIITSKKFDNYDTKQLAFLLDCESRLCEIKNGNYTIENIKFLEGMIEESIKIFNAAKQEIKLIKENNKQIKK